jgi:integrase
MEDWRAFLDVSIAGSTARKYVSAVEHFLAGRDPRDLREADVARHLRGLPMGQRWVSYWAIRSLYRWALRNDVVQTDPTVAVPRPRLMAREVRALTREELDALRRAAARKHPLRGCLVDVLFYSGARIGEVVSLRWPDIREDALLLRGTKGRRERLVPLHPALRRALDDVRTLRRMEGDGDGLVFGRGYSALYEWVAQAGAAAGLTSVHPHTLRATHATLLAAAGAPATDIQQLLGHASLVTTERYIASTAASRRRAVSLL